MENSGTHLHSLSFARASFRCDSGSKTIIYYSKQCGLILSNSLHAMIGEPYSTIYTVYFSLMLCVFSVKFLDFSVLFYVERN